VQAQPDPQAAARASPIIFASRDQARSTERDDGSRLDAQLVPPRSRYEVIAGSPSRQLLLQRSILIFRAA
jgi:hypothetical protein